MAKVLVLFYSAYGHIYQMAEAVAEGANEVDGVEAVLRQTLPDDLREKIGIAAGQAAFAHVPTATVEELTEYDAIIIGTPTRFGNMVSQMASFWDATGGVWFSGGLVGKVGGVFTSTATQHGGQESTILSTQKTLLHHGMVIVGLPYAFQGQMGVDEIKGGSPYGASTITDGDGSRQPSAVELDGARFQGRHIATIAQKLTS